MSNQARITSIDALEAFRSELIRYIDHARVALEDMSGDARRTRSWLDIDRTQHWTAQIRKLTKQLHQAEEELYSANLTSPHASNALQKMAVERARRKLADAEEKFRAVKHWRQIYDHRTGPLLQQLEPMFFQLGQRLPRAIQSLGETIKLLQDYAEAQRPTQAKPSPPPTDPTP